MKKDSKGLYTTSFTYNGKRYYVRAKTQKLLWQKVAQKQHDLESGILTANGNTTVARWSEEWLATYKKDNVRQGTYERYQSIIRRHLTAHMGAVKMKDVRPVHLQKIINSMSDMSTNTVSKVIETFHAVFDRARRNGMIASNPAENLEMPKTRPNGSRRAITAQERDYILALAQTHPAGLWVEMLLYCGLRPEETIPLQWCHIDLESTPPLVHITAAAEARTGEIKPPKSEAGNRSVPIPTAYADRLRAVRPDDHPFGYVFQRKDGQRHTATTLRGLWNDFKFQLDIAMGAQTIQVEQDKHTSKKFRTKTVILKSVLAPDLVPYCLRHTYCTDLQAAGVPINVARELMGHSDIAMTSKIYTHSSEAAVANAADAINAYLGATASATPKRAQKG